MKSNQDVYGIDQELYGRLKKIDDRLREHDESFIGFGDIYVELSHKLDTVIRQTSDLPAMRDDIEHLKKQAAATRNGLSKIDYQLMKMEAKDDYLLERVNKIDERVVKIGAREYA